FTRSNVNAGKKAQNDSRVNSNSLKIQYGLTDHIIVHTAKRKSELEVDFGIQKEKVSVIPFGINNTVPNNGLSCAEARRQLGLNTNDKTMLFFGNIAQYKGLEYLIAAFSELLKEDRSYRLLIVRNPT